MMNTLRHDARSGGRHDNEAKRSEGSRVSGPRDWVFAFHDGDALDLQGISLLLTARTLAESQDRQIWLAGLPREFWYFMEIMGLEGLFLPFPELQPGEA